MQTISFKNHTPTMVRAQKTKNQFSVCRRDWMKCKKIWVAVREWESTLPGQAQERIAQLVIMPVCLPETIEVEYLEQTDRGAGGFGSTGRN